LLNPDDIEDHKFTGQEEDTETGLYNYNARMYDPTLGRFISADPIMGLNRYVYAGNNPINAVDPSGYESEEATKAIYNAAWDRKLDVTIDGVVQPVDSIAMVVVTGDYTTAYAEGGVPAANFNMGTHTEGSREEFIVAVATVTGVGAVLLFPAVTVPLAAAGGRWLLKTSADPVVLGNDVITAYIKYRIVLYTTQDQDLALQKSLESLAWTHAGGVAMKGLGHIFQDNKAMKLLSQAAVGEELRAWRGEATKTDPTKNIWDFRRSQAPNTIARIAFCLFMERIFPGKDTFTNAGIIYDASFSNINYAEESLDGKGIFDKGAVDRLPTVFEAFGLTRAEWDKFQNKILNETGYSKYVNNPLRYTILPSGGILEGSDLFSSPSKAKFK
ncbi:MAG: RHS repeat-associated core domain-containing protein, partial [Nitrospirota bacterium]